MTTSAVSPPAPPADLDEALGRIRSSGGRVTRAKRTLVELLFDSPDALTAEEITDRSGLEQSVVYRSLSQFEELGIAEHVHLGHGRAVYRRRGLATVPVTCVGCGRTVELGAADVRAVSRRVADRTGIALDLVHFPLSGRCADCREGTPS
ncbi:Fur family transcriptional regulator [Dermatobacter hominis]|uniref:Fur family transcriptional regulator n=1 Tax=Dermatobacter hominis TaxID=2884263 RepID=UPI001D109A38|nr:transcriptional repressor [Dermatobacter hominis]UDY34372.1 transcriptional repressor [Dermatobacter hominis]